SAMLRRPRLELRSARAAGRVWGRGLRYTCRAAGGGCRADRRERPGLAGEAVVAPLQGLTGRVEAALPQGVRPRLGIDLLDHHAERAGDLLVLCTQYHDDDHVVRVVAGV